MNDNHHARSGVDIGLTLSFQAEYLSDQQAFHDYAYVVLGDDEAAEQAVHTALVLVRDSWDELLVESNMQQQLWAIVRGVVQEYRERAERHAIAEGLEDYRQGLCQLEGDQGVFDAVTTLPPQQFDAVVLRYVLGYTPERIGWYMGLSKAMVARHCRRGKARIEQAVPSLLKKTGNPFPDDDSERATTV
ncbi:sigma-70 family RNA polymerase sigma factor [Streptomyces sp. NPDC058676]|uniref:sigma-70 family RNA polymerase sigma factor n=1 Tax=unclassified Streptomyces TaxID=2593676 RepID=UPI00365C5181